MKHRVLCGIMVFALLMSMNAFALSENGFLPELEDEAECLLMMVEEEPECLLQMEEDAGYLFQTAEAVTDAAVLEQIEPVSEERNLYRTADFALLQQLEADGQLLYWETDAPVILTGLSEDLEALESGVWTDRMLGLSYAKQNGITGEGVRIGLIDSGIRLDFAELTGADVAAGTNYLASVGTPERTNTSDTHGHGSFVATVLTSPVVGVAPGAELVPLKCFDSKSGKISYVVSAIYDAVDVYHVDVLNLSLGTASVNTSLYNAVRYAFDHGVIIVAATGNLSSGVTSSGNDPYYYPAAYPEVIGVGAVDASKGIADFSYQNDSVLVTAPGHSVYGFNYNGSGYVKGKGTSFATPFVAGAAALARSIDPTLTPLDIMDLLEETAEDLGTPGYDRTYGSGLVNIGLLLAVLREDAEGIVLSGVDGEYTISAYVPGAGNGYRVLMTENDENGRFLSMNTVLTGRARALRNLPLADTAGNCVLLFLEQEAWRPLRSVAQ